MRRRIPFTEEHLSRVAGFECGLSQWDRDVANWIQADPSDPEGALAQSIQFGTSVWLYESEAGEIIGYGSLGSTRWPMADATSGTIARTEVQIVPFLGIQTPFQGKPADVPKSERYSRQVFCDLISIAIERRRAGTGGRWLGLFVHPSNERAIHFYEVFGFEIIGVSKQGYVRMAVDLDVAAES